MAGSSPADDPRAIRFGGFLAPDRVVGDYAGVASFLVGGQRLLVTVSVALAALVEGRAGHAIMWDDYPPLAALGFDRIAEMVEDGLSASEIPLTADDADDLLRIDRVWWAQRQAAPPSGAAT